jgi:hypothetical protein
MSEEGWARCFAEPIKAGNRTLITLRDAGEYIAALPAKEAKAKHWQVAMQTPTRPIAAGSSCWPRSP